MQIQKIVDFVSFSNHLLEGWFDVEYYWQEVSVRVGPLPIHIASIDVTSAVAIDDSINIDHWHYFEDVSMQ